MLLVQPLMLLASTESPSLGWKAEFGSDENLEDPLSGLPRFDDVPGVPWSYSFSEVHLEAALDK